MRFVLLIMAACLIDQSAMAAIVEQETSLAVRIGGLAYKLEAVLAKPDLPGRLPMALITHGSPRDPADRARFSAKDMAAQARDFALRGYLAVAFLRRGFGKEGGRFVEGYDCNRPDFFAALDTAGRDIEAAASSLAERPDADASRIVGVGTSVGGASMLAFAARQPKGLAAIINISGGTGSDKPNHNCDERQLVATFGKFGGGVRVPTLWFYAANDQYFGPELVERLHQSFTEAGAVAELRKFGPVGTDGHFIFGTLDGKLLWLPALDGFLRQHQLPTWEQSGVDPVATKLSAEAKRVLARYLAAPSNKAMALSPKGVARYWSAADIALARTNSVRECQKDSGEPSCTVVLENFTSVGPR
jgi:dienelactone hydrolase